MSEPFRASIIISSYNYGRFLKKAIDSALNQTYPRTEVIVVDDGSTDNSQEIITSYKDRILAVLKENGGQASALNAGFQVSRGEVIFFLDSDDMLLPKAVKNAIELFHDPGVVKVHWPLWVVDEHDRKIGELIKPDLPEGDLRRDVVHGGPYSYDWPPTSGNAWARRFIERVFPMPEAEYRTCPDLHLAALAPLFGIVKKIITPQGFWRSHGENIGTRELTEERLRVGLWREDCCLDLLSRYCREMGINADMELWRANAWWHQIYKATQEIVAAVPPGDKFILVDEDQWATGQVVAGRWRIPFLERDGKYWGRPPDDATAIREVERLRQSGVNFMVFGWLAFWWLDYYAELHRYLHSQFRCVLSSDCVIVFELRR